MKHQQPDNTRANWNGAVLGGRTSFRPSTMVLAVCAGLATTGAQAGEPEAIEVGALSFIPTLGVKSYYDSNYYSDEGDGIDTWVNVVTPGLRIETQDHNGHIYSITSSYAKKDVKVNSVDDTEDKKARFEANLIGNIRNRLVIGGDYRKFAEDRGEGFSEILGASSLAKPDEKKTKGLDARYTYGLAIGNRISVWAKDLQTTNLTRRAVTASRDHDDRTYGIGLYLQRSLSYSLGLEYEQTDFDYGTGAISSEQDRASLTGDWSITGKTSGNFRVGRTKKDFDDPVFDDVNHTTWNVGVNWSPFTYSTLSLNTGRGVSESSGTGSNGVDTNTTLKYSNIFNERLRGSVSVTDGESKFDAADRVDDRLNYGATLNYDFRRWLGLQFFAKRLERESTTKTLDFEKDQVGVTIKLSL